MTNVLVTHSARDDLDALWDQDEDSAAEIETALEEIANDPKLADRLSERKFRNTQTPSYDVDVFQKLWQKGLNLYRLKFWDWNGSLLPYRVLYAHHPQANCFYVLAVVPRNFDYDIDHPIVQRVLADYKYLGIPTY
ncbi:type II toxin-antitoxin system RelE/ParE family toxin [Herminiimonas sp. CN]|uniref:type II toxin-antitoxin system RelE/ParE family toxin n=1 Tax=Herminiimonas sp. CN TaxID=1349818 RepID=UPI000551CC05|nr:type II toxin-antitoxin system RelE/ParE family toxin [Herminiimonas sp. CN]